MSTSHTAETIVSSSNYIAVRKDTSDYNVVIFGEAGAGKSSLVNLIAGTDTAQTSRDARGCTTETNAYDILIRNETLKVKLFDTAGLDEGSGGAVPDKKARQVLKKLLRTLMKQGGIHLIMYCVRGERVTWALSRNYTLIRSQVKKKVPIVLVVTGLENYEPDMEKWWRDNERSISNLGMTFAGHACVTTATIQENAGSELMERRNQSYHVVCNLIKQTITRTKHKNIIVFGETGTGKSSLVNLMAGQDIAVTSPDAQRCTTHWQDYTIEFDGESYNVFDTAGLEEPQLGLAQYLETVLDAYKLVQSLERQGGIDLVLFCMRAGRVTATLQSNYRLFHEFLCEKKVPIVIVVTHLEDEDSGMDDWWKRNERAFLEEKIHFPGHACITTADGGGSYPRLYKESRDTIHDVIKKFTANGLKKSWIGGNNLFVSLMRKLKELLVGNLRPRKDIVPRLTKNCGMSREVAEQLADMIKRDAVEVATST
ncbi:P-loop containing nucleoside triphosphate hydrolase protein [Suillus paluster]|uniref:P-loop containing nucleoside triphosphate hydrolase protein n=1 Tax=Suillus paluster TaxID=48578 RepID=UPI001B8633DC|nr:P-loop containing nucleoside triphosphate hydrolase protein [Suillus paluster]KAG1741410.1 P-loop containing nucleoside triphosphate hydrolase protein [Suillus paluster]